MPTHIDYTPFSTLAFETLDRWDREYHVVVIRATFDLADNGEPHIAAEQTPVVAADRYHGEPMLSSLRWESDLAPHKPYCDIILEATAYAPEGAPAKGWYASLQVGAHRKELLITGPRRWRRQSGGDWQAEFPAPITSLPLRYEYAYGGQVTRYDPEGGREQTEYCPENPLGLGYWPDWAQEEAERRDQVPVPQILAVEDNWPSCGQPLTPQGFGPICKTWLPRLTLAGTYDESWQKGRWPNLPEDFDFGFWNCAHPDLQIPYPVGNETVALHNLTPEGRRDFRLPGYLPLVLVRYGNGDVKETRAKLDTLIIAPDEGRLILVWRATILAEPPVRVLESRLPARRLT